MGLDAFRRIAERRIEEAIEEGRFDNLPGRGKPLDPGALTTPIHIHLLKNAGVLPDWAQIDRDIETARLECAQAWRRVERDYPRRRALAESPPPGAAPERRLAFERWRDRVRAEVLGLMRRVNGDIIKLNLLAPARYREQMPYRIAAETARFDACFPALDGTGVPERETSR